MFTQVGDTGLVDASSANALTNLRSKRVDRLFKVRAEPACSPSQGRMPHASARPKRWT